MKKEILVLLVTLSSYFAKAQVKLGGQIGFLNSSLRSTLDGKKVEGRHTVTGVRIGVFAEIPITDEIFFNPALNFASKGGRFYTSTTAPLFGPTIINESKTTFNYLEMPLNFTYKLDEEINGVFFGAGPVLAVGFNGETRSASTTTGQFLGVPVNEATSTSGEVIFDGKKNAKDNNKHFKAFDFGANFFVGYEFRNGIRVQLIYNPSFVNISPDDKTNIKNTNLGFTIGYKFGGSKK